MARQPFYGELRWQELPEYEPPELMSTDVRAKVWVVMPLAQSLWCLALFASLWALDGPDARLADGPVWTALQWSQLLIVLGLIGAGAAWSLARTENIHLLDGRLPTRARSIRAWIVPVLTGFVAWLILRLDPTEVLDIRPSLAALFFGLGAWRPYSLIRRLFTSFSLVREDALIASLAIVQPTTWGLLWWRLIDESDAVIEPGRLNGLRGLTLATAVAAVLSSLLTVMIDRRMSRSQLHRIGALTVRDEHRYLRSIGLDPYEPTVFTALVRARLAREAHRRGGDQPAPAEPEVFVTHREPWPNDHSRGGPPAPLRIEDDIVAPAATDPPADTESDVADPPTDRDRQLVLEFEDEAFAPVNPVGRAPRVARGVPEPEPEPEPDSDAITTDVDAPSDDTATTPAPDTPPDATPAPDTPSDDTTTTTITPDTPSDDTTTTPSDDATTTTITPDTPSDATATTPSDATTTTAPDTPSDATTTTPDTPSDAATTTAPDTPSDDDLSLESTDQHPTDTPDQHPTDEHDPTDTPDQHPTDEHDPIDTPDQHPTDDGEATDSLPDVVEVEHPSPAAAGAKVRQQESGRWLVGLEVARFTMLAALIAVALASLWVTVRALDLQEPIQNGLLSQTDVDRLDQAMSWTTRALAIAIPAQVLWIWACAAVSQRTALANTRARTAAAALAATVFLGAAALLLEPTVWLDGLAILAAAAIAAYAVRTIDPAIDALGRSRTIGWIWTGCIEATALVAVAWGIHRPMTPTTSVGWLAFLGVIETQVAALAAVLIGYMAVDFEDVVRGNDLDADTPEPISTE